MFTNFTTKSFSSSQKMKGKDQKSFVTRVSELYPALATFIQSLKSDLYLLKTNFRFQFMSHEGTLIFWNFYDSEWVPTLRILHNNPNIMKYIYNDEGSCRSLFQGAQLMAPGVHKMDQEMKQGCIYPVRINDEAEALGYIKLEMKPEDIMKDGRSGRIGEMLMIIGDGLWEAGDKV